MTRSGRVRILLVDENADNLLLTKTHLQLENPDFQIEAVSSCEDCLRKLEISDFDCIITDFEMRPGVKGTDLLENLRERKIDVPVIFLCDDEATEKAKREPQPGVEGFFNRKIGFDNISAIAELIQKAADKHRLEAPAKGRQARAARGCFILSTDGMSILETDEGADRLLKSGESVTGERRLLYFVTEDDRTEFRRLLMKVVEGKRATKTIRFHFAQGKSRPFRVFGMPYIREGKIEGAVVTLTSLDPEEKHRRGRSGS